MARPVFDEQDLDLYDRAFSNVVATMLKLQKSMTVREADIMKIGLRASHVEEALAIGDLGRAQSHHRAMLQLLKKL